jgi:hypothetical protein
MSTKNRDERHKGRPVNDTVTSVSSHNNKEP